MDDCPFTWTFVTPSVKLGVRNIICHGILAMSQKGNYHTKLMPSKVSTSSNVKVKNRLGLIEATLRVISELGYANASVSEIIKNAGLSRGMIHLHFGSKDKLIIEAAIHASERYHTFLETCLEYAGPSPQEQVEAIVKHDLSEDVLNATSVRVWYELRGAIYFHKELASCSDTRDERLRSVLFRLFSELSECYKMNDATQENAEDVTTAFMALMEGMWTDYLLHQTNFQRVDAKRSVFRFLRTLFPDHFHLTGAKLF